MFRFKTFISENDYHHSSHLNINTDKHNSGKSRSADHAMWLSHNAHQAKGWHNIQKDNFGKAHTYKVRVKGKIAHHEDKKVKALFKKHGHHMGNYHVDLISNPTHKEVQNHPATLTLKKAGYVGHTHPDYDSHDTQKDHDSTVIFHRKNTTHLTKTDVGKREKKPKPEKPKHQVPKGHNQINLVGKHDVTHQTHQEYTHGSIRGNKFEPLEKTRSKVRLTSDQASKVKSLVHKKDGNTYKHVKKKDNAVDAYVTHDNEKSRKAFHNHLKVVEGNDPKVGTGKKPKGSDRRLYTDENPKDTVPIRFTTVADAERTVAKVKKVSKPFARKIQILNVGQQRAKVMGKTGVVSKFEKGKQQIRSKEMAKRAKQ